MTKYKYGMRLRGFSIGCQPLGGLRDVKDDPTGRYYDILFYDRMLEQYEIDGFELIYLGAEEHNESKSKGSDK